MMERRCRGDLSREMVEREEGSTSCSCKVVRGWIFAQLFSDGGLILENIQFRVIGKEYRDTEPSTLEKIEN